MSDPPAFSVRRSRAGGNPDLGISGIFQDCCNFKLLDSRLRGNDGGGFGKIAPPVFRRPFALSLLRFFCRRSDSRIRHFQQRYFGNDRRVKYFCRIQVSDLHLNSCLRGNDGGGLSKARCPRFQTTICLVGVHCSVGFAHDNVRYKEVV